MSWYSTVVGELATEIFASVLWVLLALFKDADDGGGQEPVYEDVSRVWTDDRDSTRGPHLRYVLVC